MTTPCGSCSVQTIGPEGQQVALRLWCKRWDCANCGPRKKKKFLRLALKGRPTTFLTLTVNPERYAARIDAFKAASLAIPTLIKRLRRRFPRSEVEYVLVWENTKAGWPHAHMLLRCPFVPKTYLSRAWYQLTGAYIVDIQRVKSLRQVAGYLGKYLAKDPQVPPGAKHFRKSHLYARADEKKSLPDWLQGLPFHFATESTEHFASLADSGRWHYALLEDYIHVLYPA